MRKLSMIAAAIVSTLQGVSASTVAQQGSFTPEAILPDGVDNTVSVNPYTKESGPARKGTVAATLNNIALLNELFAHSSQDKDKEQIEEITKAIKALLPSLRVIGVFDLFSVEEWLGSQTQQGRVYVAALYLQHYPQEMSIQVADRLKALKDEKLAPAVIEAVQEALSKKA